MKKTYIFTFCIVLGASTLLSAVTYSQSSQPVVLFDSLNGQTSGVRLGGSFTGGGWKVTNVKDQIRWDLPVGITGPGSVEIQVTNFNPRQQCIGTNKDDFLAFYGTGGKIGTTVNGSPMRAHWRSGNNYFNADGETTSLKFSALSPKGFYEGKLSDVPRFDLTTNKTYTFRIEWDTQNIRWLIDGVKKAEEQFTPSSAFPIKYIFVGRDNAFDEESCVGPIYSNLRVTAQGGSPAPTLSPCNLLTSSNPIPTGFGAAYNVFLSTKELLINALCPSSGSGNVNISVGNGSNNLYIYDTGYYWDGSQWRLFDYAGSNKVVGAWYVGNANYSLNRSSSQLAETNYLITYMCTQTGSAWKCGCRDSACTENLWNLQVFRRQ